MLSTASGADAAVMQPTASAEAHVRQSHQFRRNGTILHITGPSPEDLAKRGATPADLRRA